MRDKHAAGRRLTVILHLLALAAAGLQVLLPGAGLAQSASAPATAKLRISTEPGHAMTPLGGGIDIQVRVLDAANVPVSGELTARAAGEDNPRTAANLSINESGLAVYRFQSPPGAEAGIQAVEFRHTPSGVTHKFYVDAVDQATYDAFEKTAARIKLDPLPAHLLFIGDSLTDMSRGQNYVDKVGFWLWKTYGRKATVKNAGVGGDYILRVWQRLTGDPAAYRLSMYDGLYEPMPTRVFFFLGHNDSKLTSRSQYKTPVVPLAEFEAKYRLAIHKVQKETGAKVTVISATSSVYEITKATSDRRLAEGQANNLFGKPETLEQFNAIAKKVADQCRAEYLDVYEPTRLHPDKRSLFTSDGVHVTNLGNRLLALEVLKHLAEE